MLVQVKVDWFDELKGIGEGKTSDGETVFLNHHFVEAKGHFAGLKKDEAVMCLLESNKDKSLYASKIIKQVDERTEIHKSSFLDPVEIPKDPEASL